MRSRKAAFPGATTAAVGSGVPACRCVSQTRVKHRIVADARLSTQPRDPKLAGKNRLALPAAAAFEPELVLSQVGHDYRGFGSILEDGIRQGFCNNDVICPIADAWRANGSPRPSIASLVK